MYTPTKAIKRRESKSGCLWYNLTDGQQWGGSNSCWVLVTIRDDRKKKTKHAESCPQFS